MPAADPRWMRLLTTARLGRTESDKLEDVARGAFDRDFDRIINSSNFRRLKDKTQVFPLSDNDFVRTRLTHSLEVSCIGRTLGRRVQNLLSDSVTSEADIGAIVAAACLAHDIGNPPFGHSGEFAIQDWARRNIHPGCYEYTGSAAEYQDLWDFDGNAQSLRVVSRIQNRRRVGGMQLTLPTIGAMLKYPCGSLIGGETRAKDRLEQKKCGYFNDDKETIVPALTELGLCPYAEGAFHRHPLAFLVEAADDISNAIVDLEDSVDQNLVPAEEAIDLLTPLARLIRGFERKYDGATDELERQRAYATSALTAECARVFKDNLEPILDGRFDKSLIDDAEPEFQEAYKKIRDKIESRSFKHPAVLEIEAAGFKVIGGLMDMFVQALTAKEWQVGKVDKKLIWLFQSSYLRQPGIQEEDREVALARMSIYQKILAVTDYISGMTDSYAVDLYQKLSGIRLPT